MGKECINRLVLCWPPYSHGIELQKVKDVHQAAEKIRREKWIDEKTKKIKVKITVRLMSLRWAFPDIDSILSIISQFDTADLILMLKIYFQKIKATVHYACHRFYCHWTIFWDCHKPLKILKLPQRGNDPQLENYYSVL